MNPKLSVVLITRNEEADLPACLESVRPLSPEIIVIDHQSSDRTVEIAESSSARVHQQPFVDFASQKQAGLDRASGEWVLSLDADERLSPELALEISKTLEAGPSVSAFDIPFEVHFMGRKLRFGGLGGESHVRLFRREAGRFVGGIHEGLEIRGKIGRLKGKIIHIPYRDLREYLYKMAQYTTMAAEQRFTNHKKFSPLHHLLPLWEFFVRTIVRLGILDGTPGVAWAGLSSVHTWIKFLKLRELQAQNGILPSSGENR